MFAPSPIIVVVIRLMIARTTISATARDLLESANFGSLTYPIFGMSPSRMQEGLVRALFTNRIWKGDVLVYQKGFM